MRIRPATEADVPQIVRLFHDSIHLVNRADYTPEQLQAWAPEVPPVERWIPRLATRLTLVADDAGTLAGFGELEPNGHLDCFYCHHAFQRRGVGSRIYLALEAAAREQSLDRLFAEASLTARPFFERMGFRLVRPQTVFCRGVALPNFAMEKSLSPRNATDPTAP